MSCGQTAHHPAVLDAMGQQVDGPIYYPPYWKLELDTIDLVQQVMGTQNDILLVAGSGTYGLEAAFTTLIEPHDKVLVVSCGKYGQLLADVVDIVGGKVVLVEEPRGQTVSVARIRDVLRDEPHVSIVATVHCDTNTGVMTSIDKVGKMLAEEFPDKLFLVDAISSLGGAQVEVDEWSIDVCCSTAQKCLNGPQGLAIVSVSNRCWDHIARRTNPIPTLCLDLSVWKAYHEGIRRAYESEVWGDISSANEKAVHGPSPSYALVSGLHAALKVILAEGLDSVFERHSTASQAVRNGVRGMGLGVLASEDAAAPVCTRLVFPEEVDWTTLASRAFRKYSLALASDFRIGTMGQSAQRATVLEALRRLEMTLTDLGYPVTDGVEAAQAVFEQA